MYKKLPALSGPQLLRLLQKDGWAAGRKAKHGVALTKSMSERTKVTIIPTSRAPLDDGTLSAILGSKQTGIGKKGLLELLEKYGL